MDCPAIPVAHKCSNCLKIASIVCKDTPDGAGNLTALYYCTQACQKAHWNAHKPECEVSQSRRAVYRAGYLVQALHFTFRRNTWSWPISKVERDRLVGIGETWRIFDAEHPGNEVSYFLPFPEVLFPKVQDQEAVLSHSDCRNAIADMGVLTNDLLKDICSDIREVSTSVNDTPLTILRHRICSPKVCFFTRRHEVLQVTLKNREVYALDMTGAQYGWPLPATMPWGTFVKDRVEIVKEIRKFGETAQDLQVERAATNNEELRYHHRVMDEMKQCFDMLLKQWQNNVSLLTDMLKLPEEDFQCKQASLFQFMNEEMAALRLKFNKGMAAATAAAIERSRASKNLSPTS